MKILPINKILSVGLALMLSCFFARAEQAVSRISVDDGYIRATIPGTTVSSAYMTITNNAEKPAILVGASSDVSERIEIHQHVMAQGMMKMRKQDSLTIPENSAVTLQPAGYHLMIFDVKQPLKADEKIFITLHFSDEKDVSVSLPVRSIVDEKPKSAHHHH